MPVLFFTAIARPAIWGDTLVKNHFGYHWMPDGTAQTWAFSCDPKGSNVCENGPLAGRTLAELWRDHQELFGHPGEPFPVIVSLVGPEERLSVQVHPTTELACRLGFPFGKNEAWYFLETPEDATIVYGHRATSEEDLRQKAAADQWDQIIRELPVRVGDFVYAPAGTVHGVGKGCVTYEVQQATDVTFRLYDYHRKDAQGKERELHFEQGVACITAYPQAHEPLPEPVVEQAEGGERTTLISNDSFTVTRVVVSGTYRFDDPGYELATVVAGTGRVDGITVSIGDSFLIPQGEGARFEGAMSVMMTRR